VEALLRKLGVDAATPAHSALRRLDVLGVSLAASAFAASLAGDAWDSLAADHVLTSFRDLLDPQQEASVFTLVAAAATLACALGAMLVATTRSRRRGRLVVLAVMLAFLYADELRVVHERLGERLADALGVPREDVGVRLWTVIYLPLIGVVALLLVEAARTLAGGGGRIVLGLGFLAAAVSLEALGIVTYTLLDVPGEAVVRGALEEACEIAGWTLVATGLFVGYGSSLLAPDSDPPGASAGITRGR
jgi:hypothetical protein